MPRTVTTVLTLKDRMTEKFRAINNSSDKTAKSVQRRFTMMGKKISNVGKNFQNVGRNLTTGVTLPIVGAATIATKKFADVDKTMALVESTMGKTKFAAGDLNKAMKEAAANSTFGMNDAAQAALNFARGGWDAGQAAYALAPAMNLAAGEGGDLDTVSAGLMATMNAFGADAGDAAHYADVFANACNNSALDVNSLSDSMSVASASFNTVEDAALAMGVMADRGIDANVAANALKSGMGRLADPAKSGAMWMEKLGINAFDSSGNMKEMTKIQSELHTAFSGLSDQERKAAASAIFGKNQMNSWLQLIDTAPSDVKELSAALEKEKTSSKMADDMMSGFGGSLEKIKSSVDVLATSFGESLAPYIQIVADKIQEVTDKFNALSPEQRDTVVKIGMIVAAIGPALLIVGKVIGVIGFVVGHIMTIISVIGKVIGAIKMVISVVKVVFAFLAANPIILVIAAIIAVIAVVIRFRNEIWAALQAVAAKIVEFVAGVKAKFAEFAAAVQEKINTVKQKFEAFKASVASVWKSIGQAIKNGISGAFSFITGKIETVKNAFNTLKEKASNFKINLPGKGKADNNAAGTSYYKGGTTWVGENGPELLTLPSGSKIMPHTKAANSVGNSAPVINVTIQGNVIGNEEFANMISNKVAGELITAMAY